MDRRRQFKRTPEDDLLLENLKNVLRGVGRVMGRYCELVLHSLDDLDRSIVAIENGDVTGRKVGGPITDLALRILDEAESNNEEVVGPYISSTRDGKRLKSATLLVRNSSGKLIGMLCINIDISAPMENFMQALAGTDAARTSVPPDEHYPPTAKDLIHISMEKAVAVVNEKKGLSATERNIAIVNELLHRGIFNVKDAIDLVARDLGISRYTVYNYIRSLKSKDRTKT